MAEAWTDGTLVRYPYDAAVHGGGTWTTYAVVHGAAEGGRVEVEVFLSETAHGEYVVNSMGKWDDVAPENLTRVRAGEVQARAAAHGLI